MFKLGIVITCIVLGCFVQDVNSAYLDIDSFFNTSGNLAVITWAQEVHTLNALSQALLGPAMMLEGEVTSGHYISGSTLLNITTLIMGTNATSDLSLLQFLTAVENHNLVAGNHTRKGVQLNFRHVFIIDEAIITLLTTIPRLDFPVWIHAEILAGPGESLLHLPARDFLDRVVGFRNSTLSLTWTMTFPAALSNLQIDTMVQALEYNSVDQAIAFPVRADIAALSVLQLQNLANRVPRSSLVIWGTAPLFNQVAINNIRNIIINVGINRTLLVVPDNIRTTLITNLPNSAGITALSMTCFLLALLANLT